MASRRKPPQVKYPGVLGQPYVKAVPLGILGSLGDDEKVGQENLNALRSRLVLLAEHYEAREENGEIDWQKLSIALAFAHVPGLQIVARAGRGRGRPPRHRQYELYAAVIAIMNNKRTSVANACRILARRKGDWMGANSTTLETRFHAEKRQLLKYPPLPAGLFGLAALLGTRPVRTSPSTGGILGEFPPTEPHQPPRKYPRPPPTWSELLPPHDTWTEEDDTK